MGIILKFVKFWPLTSISCKLTNILWKFNLLLLIEFPLNKTSPILRIHITFLLRKIQKTIANFARFWKLSFFDLLTFISSKITKIYSNGLVYFFFVLFWLTSYQFFLHLKGWSLAKMQKTWVTFAWFWNVQLLTF